MLKIIKHNSRTLTVVTHEFSKSGPNGLPDPDYNDSLFQLDDDVRSAFEKPALGCTVLVETFGGKRRYYIYVANTVDVAEILSDVIRRNSNETLSWLTRPDPEWNFIIQYRQQYLQPP